MYKEKRKSIYLNFVYKYISAPNFDPTQLGKTKN